MFLLRNLLKNRTTRLLVASLIMLIVFAVFHTSKKIIQDSSIAHDKGTQTTDSRFIKSVVERTTAGRKVLADHGLPIPDSVTTYQRILLVSTWRSGSSFTGELLGNIPGALYNFEPFLYMPTRDISFRNATSASKYVHELSKMFDCDYGPLLKNYQAILVNFLRRVVSGLHQNCRVFESTSYCENPERLAEACRHFPIQITKAVRMPLRYVFPFLRKPELNLHVILLVRDPRGTISSRQRMAWCMKDCADPEKLCDLLRDNYDTALRAAKEFPERFTVIRYEDIALEPEVGANALLKRLGIPVTPSVEEYIKTHAGYKVERTRGTYRDRGSRVARWKQYLPWNDIQKVQSVCQDVFDRYGYMPLPRVEALNETQTFKPVWNLPVTMK